jgi:hypothetical protein
MPRHIGSTDGEFSVCQFFVSGEHEYVRVGVGVEEAVQAFGHYTTSVEVRLGFVTRVIITDGGDCTNAEWTPQGGIHIVGSGPEPEEEEEEQDQPDEDNPRGINFDKLTPDEQDHIMGGSDWRNDPEGY